MIDGSGVTQLKNQRISFHPLGNPTIPSLSPPPLRRRLVQYRFSVRRPLQSLCEVSSWCFWVTGMVCSGCPPPKGIIPIKRGADSEDPRYGMCFSVRRDWRPRTRTPRELHDHATLDGHGARGSENLDPQT